MSNFYKIIFSFFALILLVLIFSRLAGGWAFPDTKWDLSGDGEKIKIDPKFPLTQKFKAERDNLSRIRILFGRSYNKDAGEINLKLSGEDRENIIREKSFERSDIQSEGYYDFRFSKISDSKDKDFYLMIEFKPKNEKYKDLNIFLSNNPISGNQLITIEGEIKNGALAMRPAYQADSLTGNIQELNQRVSQYKPGFLKNIYLYIIFFAFILLAFFFLILIIWI